MHRNIHMIDQKDTCAVQHNAIQYCCIKFFICSRLHSVVQGFYIALVTQCISGVCFCRRMLEGNVVTEELIYLHVYL